MCKLSNSHESNEAKKKNLEEKKKTYVKHNGSKTFCSISFNNKCCTDDD